MKSIKISFFAIASIILLLTSCKKHKHDEDTFGTVKVSFSHLWGMSGGTFALNQDLVHPMNSETMNFTTFKYYVSNLELKKEDGTYWKHPESYFLVNLADPTTATLEMTNVPTGHYTGFRYTLGVDSLRNVSGAQTGALSTANGMFWSWNSGYIMIKAEGTSPASSSGNFAYHLGGYAGTNNVVTTNTVEFTDHLELTENATKTIKMSANPAKLFHSDAIANGSSIMMPGSRAKGMATNFYSSFAFLGLE